MRFLTTLICWALLAATAHAHALWIDQQSVSSGTTSARISFAEQPGPGALRLLDRLAGAQAWVRRAHQPSSELKFAPWRDEAQSLGALVGNVPWAAPWAIEAAFTYGVYDREGASAFLNFEAKHIQAQSVDQLAGLAQAERLAFDIVPHVQGEQLVLEVRWQQSPCANAEIFVQGPAGNTEELRTDPQGRVSLTLAPGAWQCRARLVQPELSGTANGKPYAETWRVSTLTLDTTSLCQNSTGQTPAEVAASDDRDAPALLQAARDHRAMWQQFPGYTARMTISIDDRTAQGTIHVAKDGSYSLSGLAAMDNILLSQQLRLLFSHRLPDVPVEGVATFDTARPEQDLYGRRILLEGNAMGSAYRIRDNVIREVERRLGKDGHFVIRVLNVAWNADGKYLPETFVVTTWKGNPSALQSSVLVRHQWTRVGSFDLPQRLDVLSADHQTVQGITCEFSDFALQASAVATNP